MYQLERFEALNESGQLVATFVDHGVMLTGSTKDMILNWIRNGGQVRWVPADQVEAEPYTPAATPVKVEYKTRKPRQVRKTTQKASKPAKTPKFNGKSWPVGSTVYLRWSMIDEEKRTHLSQYRTTAGEVVKSRYSQRAVRFNGDPEQWFSVDELLGTIEVDA